MKKVLLFDCDGVLADTERDGHRVAFNQMWREFGVPWQWSVEEYGRKLKIGGGKERMASLFQEPEFLAVFRPPESLAERQDLVKKWHQRKTEIYKEIIASGQNCRPLRSEALVRRGARSGLDSGRGFHLGPGSGARVSAPRRGRGERAAVLPGAGRRRGQGQEAGAGYLSDGGGELQVSPAQCVVVEDSRNGLVSAVAAGMKCVVTVSDYTAKRDFSEAAIVLTCLGDPDGEKCVVLANPRGVPADGFLRVAALEKILAS